MAIAVTPANGLSLPRAVRFASLVAEAPASTSPSRSAPAAPSQDGASAADSTPGGAARPGPARTAPRRGARRDARPRRTSAAARQGDAEATRLMAAYRDSRDPADFDALYRATQDDVLAWILSLLRGGSAHLDARELLQETFINVFRYPGSFRDESDSSYRVWVRTIAGNVLRRARSNAAQRPERELSEGSFELQDEASGPAEQSQLAESAEHLRLTWQLFLGLYLSAWEQLAERDRRALWLAEAEALPYAEVGARLGVRPANVKMIVFRARRRLAARMTASLEAVVSLPQPARFEGEARAGAPARDALAA